jgi:hypothetical protein
VLATVIVATLLLLSLILMATTLFPSINVTAFALIGGGLLAVGLLLFGAVALRSSRGAKQVTVIESGPQVPREQWTMPPIALLERPLQSTGRRIAMLSMEGYLLLAIALLIVKGVQLAGG